MLQTEAEMRTYVDVQCSLMEQTFTRWFELGLAQRKVEVPSSKKRRRQLSYGPEIVATTCPLFCVSAASLLSFCDTPSFGVCSAVCRSMARARYESAAWGPCRHISSSALLVIAKQVLAVLCLLALLLFLLAIP